MLQRSFWKIAKSALTKVVDGETVPAFGDFVVYDTTPTLAYIMAAQWSRPDIEAAGGQREDLSTTPRRARYLRTTVRREAADPADPDVVLRVKASAVLGGDAVLDADVPAILFAGDSADDVVGPAALTEATRRIAAGE